MEHRVEDRSTAEDPDGLWSGSLTCSCSWTTEVHGHPSKESAAIGLQAAWLDHSSD